MFLFTSMQALLILFCNELIPNSHVCQNHSLYFVWGALGYASHFLRPSPSVWCQDLIYSIQGLIFKIFVLMRNNSISTSTLQLNTNRWSSDLKWISIIELHKILELHSSSYLTWCSVPDSTVCKLRHIYLKLCTGRGAIIETDINWLVESKRLIIKLFIAVAQALGCCLM